MNRRCFAVLLTALIGLGGLAVVADEPPPDPGDAPVRLKKKSKPGDDKPAAPGKSDKKADEKKADEKKPDEKKDEAREGPAPTLPEHDEKEVMERLARNVRSVDDRLAKGDLNDATRQLQEDILKDIESLINQGENSSGAGGGQQDQNQADQNQAEDQNSGKGENQSKGGEKGKQGSSRAKGKSQSGPGSPGKGQGGNEGQSERGQGKKQGRQRGQLARGNQRGNQRSGNGSGQMRPGGEQPGSDMAGGKNPGSDTGDDKNQAQVNRNADLDKQDVWGHLPESMRAVMNAYAGRQEFMVKHEALIKKYYSTIATEGRRKGDRP